MSQCDGKDAYATAKELGTCRRSLQQRLAGQHSLVAAAGMFKTIKRPEGISTTDLVGRMLLMSRAHHVRYDPCALWPCVGACLTMVSAGPRTGSMRRRRPPCTEPRCVHGR